MGAAEAGLFGDGLLGRAAMGLVGRQRRIQTIENPKRLRFGRPVPCPRFRSVAPASPKMETKKVTSDRGAPFSTVPTSGLRFVGTRINAGGWAV